MHSVFSRRHIFPIIISILFSKKIVKSEERRISACNNGPEGTVEIIDLSYEDKDAPYDLEGRFSLLYPILPKTIKGVEIGRNWYKINILEPGGIVKRVKINLNGGKIRVKSIKTFAWLLDSGAEVKELYDNKRLTFYLMDSTGPTDINANSVKKGVLNESGAIEFGDTSRVFQSGKVDFLIGLDGKHKIFGVELSTDDSQWDSATSQLAEMHKRLKNKDCYAGETVEKGCIMTSTVCSMLNLSDNCFELRMMRKLRDYWLYQQSNGPEIIAWYYKKSEMFLRHKQLKKFQINLVLYYIFFIIPSSIMIKLNLYLVSKNYLTYGFNKYVVRTIEKYEISNKS